MTQSLVSQMLPDFSFASVALVSQGLFYYSVYACHFPQAIDDLQKLLEAVMKVFKWNMLGIGLGITPSVVDDIERRNLRGSYR